MSGILWRRLRLFLTRDRSTEDLEQEMRLHRELRAEVLSRSGRSPDDAEREAARRFGHTVRIAEQSRDAWGWGNADAFWQDARYAARRLRQRPGFAGAVVGILALGIGATTAMFSAVDAAFLRPLPFPRATELLTLQRVNIPSALRLERPELVVRSFDIDHVREMPDVFSHVAAYAAGGLNLADPERPRRVRAGVVSAEFFATLGVSAAHGRTIGAADAGAEAPRVVVLSWGLWQNDFAATDVIGTTIPLNSARYEVVGVMPRGFSFPQESDLWIPMSIPATWATFEPFRGYLPSLVIARTAPDVSQAVAETRMREAWQRVVSNMPREPGQELNADRSLTEIREKGATESLRAQLVGDRRTALLVLFATTALLLLIACANVTNLLLSHGASRSRELAVRTVLGATRGRVLRQLLAESVMLSVCGAAVGIAVAPVVLGALRTLMPEQLAGVAPVQLDLRVLAFATTLAVVTGILFGLWPAFGATRGSAVAAIKAGGGHGASAGGTRRAQRVLVGGEIAMAGVLLVGAGLMLKSFERLVSTETGMEPDQVATLELSFVRGMSQPARIDRLAAILDEVRRVPGVTAAGAVNDLPLRGGGGIGISVKVDGAPRSAVRLFPRYLVASEGYFEALGIERRRGRYFTDVDGTGTDRVAIISEAMASAYWPDQDPVGRTFIFGGEDPPVRVIGVVADVRESGLERDPGPQMYFPARANIDINMAIVARGAAGGGTLLGALTRAVRRVDPAQAVYNVRMMDDVIGASMASRRANTMLIALFGLLALVIAGLGVYAVTANAVAQRSREFGIRAALGATRGALLRHVGGEMAVVVVSGVLLGAALAWAVSRVMAGMIFGVTVHDTTTFVAAPLVLVLAVALATLVPARRAMRVEPVTVMKSE
ncbi:MAG TPA: ABC transporter permease [Gemmatimonadaceae bacterium]